MSHVLGIDLSLTGTGVVHLVLGKPVIRVRIESKQKGTARLIEIEEKLKSIINAHPLLDLVLIEGYAYAAANQAHQTGELGGVIRVMLNKKMLRWIEVAPSQVKKFAIGKGNAKKDLVLLNVFKKWGVEFETSDEADAFVLAKIGQALLNDDHDQNNKDSLRQYQLEVIEELYKKYKEVLPNG